MSQKLWVKSSLFVSWNGKQTNIGLSVRASWWQFVEDTKQKEYITLWSAHVKS